MAEQHSSAPARAALVIAFLVTVAWAAAVFAVHFDFLWPSRQVMFIALSSATLLLFWSLIVTLLFYARTMKQLRELRVKIAHLRSSLVSEEVKFEPQSIDAGIERDPIPAKEELTAEPQDTPAYSEPDAAGPDEPLETSRPSPPGLPASPLVVIRASNFADDENDIEAFEALDQVSADSDFAELLELSMRVLQLLADYELSIDEIATDIVDPETWRTEFRSGPSGNLAVIGRFGSDEDLARVRTLLDQQEDFGDLVDRFAHCGKVQIERFMEHADDHELLDFVNTRTIRACILTDTARLEK